MTVFDHSLDLFYILHFLQPFEIYCLTGSDLFPLCVVVLWELVEFGMYELLGNYSLLFLQEGEQQMEPVYDILLFDIGGGMLGIVVGWAAHKAIGHPVEPRVRAGCSSASQIAVFVAKLLVLCPLSAVGWECLDLLDDLCTESDRNAFPWGIIGIALIETVYICVNWSGADPAAGAQRNMLLLSSYVLFATSLQRAASGAFVALVAWWVLGLVYLGVWLIRVSKSGPDYEKVVQVQLKELP